MIVHFIVDKLDFLTMVAFSLRDGNDVTSSAARLRGHSDVQLPKHLACHALTHVIALLVVLGRYVVAWLHDPSCSEAGIVLVVEEPDRGICEFDAKLFAGFKHSLVVLRSCANTLVGHQCIRSKHLPMGAATNLTPLFPSL